MPANNFYKKIVFSLLQKVNRGTLVWREGDSRETHFGEGRGPLAEICVKNEDFYRKIILFGDIGFGESYMEGDWQSPDLVKLIRLMILNLDDVSPKSGISRVVSPLNILKAYNRVKHFLRPNSIQGARKNIAEHYDLSNEFFKLFLDKSMTYSSAFFKSENETLEMAQNEKYNLLCQSVKLKSGDNLLEIGCGWGGFAVFAARNYGCRVTGITISKEQFDFAKELVKSEKLEDKVQILLKDYRLMEGKFDKIISIEMIEAVGHRYFKDYFAKIDSLLADNGIVGIQAIIIPDSKYEAYRKSVDWIQKYIFPGGLLPCISKINQSVNQVSTMNLYNLNEFGLSYAKTLNTWKKNMFESQQEILKLGFNDAFLRKWEYYFSYCEAAFLQRNINVVQLVYSRPNNPAI